MQKIGITSILFCFFLFLGAAITAQVPVNKNKTDKKGQRQGTWTITFDKNWNPTSIKDSIAYYRVIQYKNDKPQGITTDYYLSGQKQYEAKLIADRPQEIVEGKATWYHENGSPSQEAIFVNGLREGVSTFYFTSGKKQSETFFKQGNIQERIIYYNEDGEIINVEFYENGQQVLLQPAWEKAITLYQNGNYKDAERLLSDLHIAIKYKLGPDDGNIAFLLTYLWTAQLKLGKKDLALKSANEMCRVREAQKIPKDSVYRDWLYDLVANYKPAGLLNEMERPLKKILILQEEISGVNSEKYFFYRRLLGDYYRYQKRFDEGEKVFLENIERLKKIYPAQPSRYNYELTSLGYLYESRQDYTKAENLYREAIQVYRSQKDTTEKYVNTLTNLMDLYQTEDKNVEATPLGIEIVALQKSRHGKNSKKYASALLELSKSYRELEQFDKVELLANERAEIIASLHSKDSYEYANILFEFGILYDEEKSYEKAESYYQQAIDWLKVNNTKGNVPETHVLKLAEVSAYLGALHAQNKNTVKAEIALTEASENIKKLTDKSDFSVAQIYEKIGTSQFRIGNYADAEDAYKEAVALAKNLYGTNHHNYFLSVSNLCLLYTYSNRPEETVRILDDLLQKIAAESGKNNASYTSLLSSKVLALEKLGQDSLAIAARKDITEFYRQTMGELSPSYARQLGQLIQKQTNKYYLAEAETNLKILEEILRKRGIKKTDEPYYNDLMVLQSFLAYEKKDYKLAIEISREQAAIGQQVGQPKLGLVSLGLMAFANNEPELAMEAYQKYINLVMDDVRKTFPYLSENQKVAFYNSEIEYHLDLYYFFALAEPLGLKMGRDSAEAKQFKETLKKINYIRHPNNAKIFNYQLLTKGILFEANQKMKQAILSGRDQGLIKLFNDWQTRKVEMNKIFLEPDSKEKEEKKNRVNLEIKALEKQLAIKSSYFTQTSNQELTWRDVQKKLKKGEALVEILAISAGIKLDPAKNKHSDAYLAFVITPDTKDYPLCVRMGYGDSLEGKYSKNYQNSIKFKMADQYSYNKYWKVLADTLKGINKIYFAPDGIYHKINVNTLRNPITGKYVLEEKEIRFITQARDFINQKESLSSLPKKLILFGSPNYNNLPTTINKEDKDRGSSPTPDKSFLTVLKTDSAQRFFQGESITELPGTETEVNNVAAIAQKYQLSVQKFLRDDATETSLKMVESPSVLHIATHGFFMSENSLPKSEDGRSGFANFSSDDLKNPLRRSGLLFSFCKQAFSREKNKVNLPEDGILTADEAQNLHLDNTDMVVLSACETGLGEVKNGEGVYGLQRAFQTAGSKSVLMSLWTVSDQATQELMTEFYTQWFLLKDRRKAFRQAQLNIREKYNDPFYWGAFVMVGN